MQAVVTIFQLQVNKDLIMRLKIKTGDLLTDKEDSEQLCGMCDWVKLEGEDWRLKHGR